MNPYEILGVPVLATTTRIKAAYLAKCKEFHPDKNPEGAEWMPVVNRAYKDLLDRHERDRLNVVLRMQRKWPAKFCPRCKGTGEALVGGNLVECAKCAGKGV